MKLNCVQLWVAALCAVGCSQGVSDPSLRRSAARTAAETVSVKINFQPVGVPPPAGYLADTGDAFGDRGNGFLYGWDMDNSAAARERMSPESPDLLHDTFIHMQKGVPDARWEIAVPDGSYDVHLVSGDPMNFDSDFQINVEDKLIISGIPTPAMPWYDNTVRVVVADGLLTISNAPTGMNDKVNFIEIDTADGPGPVAETDGGTPPARDAGSAPPPNMPPPNMPPPNMPPPTTGTSADAGRPPGPITTPGAQWGCAAAGSGPTGGAPSVLLLLALLWHRRRR
jgi:uncharacterized protein (TIGR03382 family)